MEELGCSGRVSSSCSTRGIRSKQSCQISGGKSWMIKGWIVITTTGTYPWLFVPQRNKLQLYSTSPIEYVFLASNNCESIFPIYSLQLKYESIPFSSLHSIIPTWSSKMQHNLSILPDIIPVSLYNNCDSIFSIWYLHMNTRKPFNYLDMICFLVRILSFLSSADHTENPLSYYCVLILQSLFVY